jgi:carboxyl-terminal processing protease
LSKAVNYIKGPKGTTVKLTIEREGKTLVVDVVRDVIKINALEYEMKNDVIVIKLMQFNQNAAREFDDISNLLKDNKKIKGIILDMRDNPGGLLTAAVRIMEYFVGNHQPIVKIKYGAFTQTQNSTGVGEIGEYPMIVLINKGSASASEIVAGTLQDYGMATIIGEQSFGKGTVQEVNFFQDQSSLKITVAEWLTPLGNSIQDKGITPDIVVKRIEGSEIDNQLNLALEEIRKQF